MFCLVVFVLLVLKGGDLRIVGVEMGDLRYRRVARVSRRRCPRLRPRIVVGVLVRVHGPRIMEEVLRESLVQDHDAHFDLALLNSIALGRKTVPCYRRCENTNWRLGVDGDGALYATGFWSARNAKDTIKRMLALEYMLLWE